MLLLKCIWGEGTRLLPGSRKNSNYFIMLLRKYKAHKIGVLVWDLGRTGLTGDGGFASEHGSVFTVHIQFNSLSCIKVAWAFRGVLLPKGSFWKHREPWLRQNLHVRQAGEAVNGSNTHAKRGRLHCRNPFPFLPSSQ